MGCHTRAPESPRSHFGSGAGGEGQNAHPNASNIAFVHMFCPPLNAGGGGDNLPTCERSNVPTFQRSNVLHLLLHPFS
jgi:hypothetical protein